MLSYKYKVWLEFDGEPLLGPGRYELLQHITQTHSLKESAERLNIAYKTAYNYIKKIEERLGEKIIVFTRGGAKGGGTVSLTRKGQELIEAFNQAKKKVIV